MLEADVSWLLPVGSTSLLPLPIHHQLGPPSTILRTFVPSWRTQCPWLFLQVKLCALPNRGLPEGGGTKVRRQFGDVGSRDGRCSYILVQEGEQERGQEKGSSRPGPVGQSSLGSVQHW